jgi:hypothetical protein
VFDKLFLKNILEKMQSSSVSMSTQKKHSLGTTIKMIAITEMISTTETDVFYLY